MNLEKIYKEEDFFPREITSYEKNTAVYTGKSTNETAKTRPFRRFKGALRYMDKKIVVRYSFL